MPIVKYTEDHEWISVEGSTGTVGITDYAQSQLGDIVFVELPEIGLAVEEGGEAAVVESVKAASEVYAPVSGAITEVNQGIIDDPSLVNSDPLGAGWFFRMSVAQLSELDDLMDEAAYRTYVEGLE